MKIVETLWLLKVKTWKHCASLSDASAFFVGGGMGGLNHEKSRNIMATQG